ncbi:MAG: efflux transporter periplasmic adaptor subunit [Thiobacillus sp. 63-78]|uniref:efflux RND transporter periplasmic adaptor subunit n=1 Tax=Thiobacillus sp. 63-78 TaxID=1895859 RepID=UPI0009685808|nr:efflux RND transporter periplasmic adaptor subunit [Thiobacillus sp. 63-78]MBN8773994.1 efflux RND transporter periplasmic adaptor subunit [Thiobacillus sp.]OJZ15837.1 MAG: efflux transporter periplasmic adaptor subunit [Thiobacillus sp. 63-78]
MLPRKIFFRLSTPAVLVAALALSACGRSEAPPPQMAPAEVTVVTMKQEKVSLTRELPGRTNAYLLSEVRPQVTGIVKQRLFTEGAQVKAGQPLYQLDDATYQANLASAKASLARARASLTQAELNARRSDELVRIDAVSRQDHDNATATLAQARADVAAAEAAVQSSTVTLNYARITSPIGGRIGKSSVTPGALVTANQAAALATVQQLDPVYVDLTQSASELLQLRKEVAAGKLTRSGNVPVKILLEDGSLYKHEGKLDFADVSVDPGTGSYALRVTVPNPDNILMPGLYVRAIIGSGMRDHAILVPQQGIARDPKGNTSAMIVGKDGKVEARPVKVSRTIGDQWLVEDGLAAGDRVIVAGLQKIRPGAPVKAVEAADQAAPAQTPASGAAAAEASPAPAAAKQ